MKKALAVVLVTRPCADCGVPHPFVLEAVAKNGVDGVLLCPPCLAARVARVQAVPTPPITRRRRRTTP